MKVFVTMFTTYMLSSVVSAQCGPELSYNGTRGATIAEVDEQTVFGSGTTRFSIEGKAVTDDDYWLSTQFIAKAIKNGVDLEGLKDSFYASTKGLLSYYEKEDVINIVKQTEKAAEKKGTVLVHGKDLSSEQVFPYHNAQVEKLRKAAQFILDNKLKEAAELVDGVNGVLVHYYPGIGDVSETTKQRLFGNIGTARCGAGWEGVVSKFRSEKTGDDEKKKASIN